MSPSFPEIDRGNLPDGKFRIVYEHADGEVALDVTQDDFEMAWRTMEKIPRSLRAIVIEVGKKEINRLSQKSPRNEDETLILQGYILAWFITEVIEKRHPHPWKSAS